MYLLIRSWCCYPHVGNAKTGALEDQVAHPKLLTPKGTELRGKHGAHVLPTLFAERATRFHIQFCSCFCRAALCLQLSMWCSCSNATLLVRGVSSEIGHTEATRRHGCGTPFNVHICSILPPILNLFILPLSFCPFLSISWAYNDSAIICAKPWHLQLNLIRSWDGQVHC